MNSSQKTKTLFIFYGRLLGLYVVFFALIGILSTFIPELLSEEYKQSFLTELLETKPLQLVVLAVIFAPIMEEMMFRTLVQPTHADLILLLCSWPVFYTNHYIPKDVNWLLKLLFIAIFLFVVYYILSELIPEKQTARLRTFLNKHYKIVIVLSSLIFGLVHINNYVEDFIINAALIVLIVPRILSGFMMALIKIKNANLGWSMGLHALNNGVVIALMLLAK